MIKKLSLSTALAVATVGIGAFTQSAQAIVLWNWSFDTEAGTFETDGQFSDTTGPFTFIIDPDSFEVTTSTEAATIGADLAWGQTMLNARQGKLLNWSTCDKMNEAF